MTERHNSFPTNSGDANLRQRVIKEQTYTHQKVVVVKESTWSSLSSLARGASLEVLVNSSSGTGNAADSSSLLVEFRTWDLSRVANALVWVGQFWELWMCVNWGEGVWIVPTDPRTDKTGNAGLLETRGGGGTEKFGMAIPDCWGGRRQGTPKTATVIVE